MNMGVFPLRDAKTVLESPPTNRFVGGSRVKRWVRGDWTPLVPVAAGADRGAVDAALERARSVRPLGLGPEPEGV